MFPTKEGEISEVVNDESIEKCANHWTAHGRKKTECGPNLKWK
jgi:hypothetical protein